MMKMITYMKIKHHSIFNNLNKSTIDWESIRKDSSEKQYYLPQEKQEYIKEANNSKAINKANEVHFYLNRLNVDSIFSLGSGRAYLEYQLKQKGLNVDISDLDSSINLIARFNIFDKVYQLSFEETMGHLKNYNGLVLLSRIDTEIDDLELIRLFQNLSDNKVKYIYFIPAQLLTFKSFLIEIYIRLKSILINKKLIFCGYSRTEKTFIKFWGKYYKIIAQSNTKSYLLELR